MLNQSSISLFSWTPDTSALKCDKCLYKSCWLLIERLIGYIIPRCLPLHIIRLGVYTAQRWVTWLWSQAEEEFLLCLPVATLLWWCMIRQPKKPRWYSLFVKKDLITNEVRSLFIYKKNWNILIKCNTYKLLYCPGVIGITHSDELAMGLKLWTKGNVDKVLAMDNNSLWYGRFLVLLIMMGSDHIFVMITFEWSKNRNLIEIVNDY